MSQTPASGLTAYATVADVQARADQRSLLQWLSDTDIPLTSLSSSTALPALLAQASGLVEAACLVGSRYQINNNTTPPVNDLLAIQNSGTNASALLAGLVVDLTVYLIWLRRPARQARAAMPLQTDVAFKLLDDLRDGKMLFGTLENQASGVVSDYVMTGQDWLHQNLTVVQARPYFGTRCRDYPPPV